jgi:hypothetical protein
METTHRNATNLVLEFQNACVVEKVKLDSGRTIINSFVGNGHYCGKALGPPALDVHLSQRSMRVGNLCDGRLRTYRARVIDNDGDVVKPVIGGDINTNAINHVYDYLLEIVLDLGRARLVKSGIVSFVGVRWWRRRSGIRIVRLDWRSFDLSGARF